MASIHRHSSGCSRFWYAKFRDDTGRVKIKCTKQENRNNALRVALEWERLAAPGRHKVITEEQCRKVIKELLVRVTGDKDALASNTVEEFLNNWIKGAKHSNSEGTATRYAGTVKLFLKALGSRAKLSLDSLTARDFENFRDAQRERKAASTVNVDIKTLRTAFNCARQQEIMTINNPAELIKLLDEARHVRGVFTPEQVKALVDTAEGEWKTAILIACYTGCRIGDAVSMTWENVDFKGDVKSIIFKPIKTSRQNTIVQVPLHADLDAHLMTLVGDDPKAKLTPTLADMPVGGRSGLSRHFKDIMAKARVDDGRIESTNGKKGRAFSTFSFHSLRHSFVSALANADVTEDLRMKLSGHSTLENAKHYTHTELATLQRAINKLPSINTTQK